MAIKWAQSSKEVTTHPEGAHPKPIPQENYERNPAFYSLLVKVVRGVFHFGVLKQP